MSLLVDVFPTEPAVDAARVFQAAKDLSAMGAPAPAFAQAKDRLMRGQAVVAQVSRAFALEVIAKLKAGGVEAMIRRAAAPRRRSRAPLVVGALALVLATGVAVQRSRKPALVAPVVAAPVKEAPPPLAGLSTQQLSKKVMGSVASLRCLDQVGSGFFIGEERLVTNAHVLCAADAPLAVVLPDGRRLLGKIISRDEWTDLAQVDVFGANAVPLKLGDTTSLEPGDPLVFIGSPNGLEFTVHEGKVSFVGRNFLGLAYVQINASVNPGNSGGPLFNDRGEALGIVSMKVTDTDGIGLALPLEYAQAPADGAALARWKAILARVAEQDRRDQAAERSRLQPNQPQLLATRELDGQGLAAVIMERWNGGPQAVTRDFTLSRGRSSCGVRAEFGKWASLKDTQGRRPESRRIAWMLRNKIADGIYLSAGLLESVDCAPAQLTGDAELALAGEAGARFTIEARHLRVRELAPPRPPPVAVAMPVQPAPEEELWRARFRSARQKVEAVEQNLAKAQQEIEHFDRVVAGGGELSGVARTEYHRLKGVVNRSAEDRRAVADELHELERQAAFSAVPFEWRR